MPVGIGLKQVLLITASKSDSYHILSTPAAPAPIPTAIKEIREFNKLTFSGAINIPTVQVNNTSDITLGFIRFMNDSICFVLSNLEDFSLNNIPDNYFILGSSSKVWNGGGDDTVHSRVVAPTPHGFFDAASFFIKEYIIFNRNTPTPIIEI